MNVYKIRNEYYAGVSGAITGHVRSDIPRKGAFTFCPAFLMKELVNNVLVKIYFVDGNYLYVCGENDTEKFIEDYGIDYIVNLNNEEIIEKIILSLDIEPIILDYLQGRVERVLCKENNNYYLEKRNCHNDNCYCVSHPEFVKELINKERVVKIIKYYYKIK